MTRVVSTGSLTGKAVVLGAAALAVVGAGVVVGTGLIGGGAGTTVQVDGSVSVPLNSVFAAMLVGEAVGTRLDASVTAGVPSGGVDCTATNTCGAAGSGTCCKGATRRTLNASTTCTVKGVARGTNAAESGGVAAGTQLVSDDGATVSCSSNDDYGYTRVAGGSVGASVASLTQISVVALGKIVTPTVALTVRHGGVVSGMSCTSNTGSTLLTNCSCTSNCSGTLSLNDKIGDDNVRPAGIHTSHVTSLGNAIDCNEPNTDQRTYWQWGTQSTDPSCLNGLCSDVAGTDINGDPGVSGHFACSWMAWANTTLNLYGHFFGGADINATCKQNKALEDWQWGATASATTIGWSRTCGAANCPAGDIGGDKRTTGSSAGGSALNMTSTAHFYTIEIFTRNTATGTACTADDSGAVSCGSTTKKNTVSTWLDGAQYLNGVVIQTWSNGFDLNGMHWGSSSAAHLFTSHLCCAAANSSGNDPVADSEACVF